MYHINQPRYNISCSNLLQKPYSQAPNYFVIPLAFPRSGNLHERDPEIEAQRSCAHMDSGRVSFSHREKHRRNDV